MSSHHVIRDEQEPPVFILDKDFNLESLNELLGWSPLVYVEESLCKWLLARSIKIDGVLKVGGDKNVNNYDIPTYQKSTGQTMLSFICSIIADKKFTGFNIFCDIAQRTSIVSQAIKKAPALPICLFSAHDQTIITPKNEFVKWFPVNTKIKLHDERSIVSPPSIRHENTVLIENEGKYKFTSANQPLVLTITYP